MVNMRGREGERGEAKMEDSHYWSLKRVWLTWEEFVEIVKVKVLKRDRARTKWSKEGRGDVNRRVMSEREVW